MKTLEHLALIRAAIEREGLTDAEIIAVRGGEFGADIQLEREAWVGRGYTDGNAHQSKSGMWHASTTRDGVTYSTCWDEQPAEAAA